MHIPNKQERREISLIERYGVDNASECVQASHQQYRPTLARCLAMLEMESSGRNIFGADPGGTALPRAWFDTPVTEQKYQVYKMRRNEGMTPNGVGPTQLTATFLQVAAEKRGGCWVPLHNMEVGFAYLHTLMLQRGEWGGFESYNGSGPAAIAYANRAVAHAKTWRARLVTIGE
jgi:hypothetical protein